MLILDSYNTNTLTVIVEKSHYLCCESFRISNAILGSLGNMLTITATTKGTSSQVTCYFYYITPKDWLNETNLVAHSSYYATRHFHSHPLRNTPMHASKTSHIHSSTQHGLSIQNGQPFMAVNVLKNIL